MTKKADLQKELLENVKEGIKPSDLKRKLKRSKSADDIVNIPAPPPPPLPPNHLLADQLKEKQKEIEQLRKASETKSTTIRLLRESLDRDDKEQVITELQKELATVKQQLDNSLEARLNSLTDFTKQQEQIKALNKELEETVEQASNELNAGDNEISQLRNKVWTLKSAKESLERELKLTRINRGTSVITNSTNSFETNLNYLQYALYSLLAIWFVLFLTKTKTYD